MVSTLAVINVYFIIHLCFNTPVTLVHFTYSNAHKCKIQFIPVVNSCIIALWTMEWYRSGVHFQKINCCIRRVTHFHIGLMVKLIAYCQLKGYLIRHLSLLLVPSSFYRITITSEEVWKFHVLLRFLQKNSSSFKWAIFLQTILINILGDHFKKYVVSVLR